jgi:hypothetical protein
MPDWATYTLSDLQIFSARAYARLFEAYNAAVWPAQIATLALGLLLVRLSWTPGRRPSRAAAAILAAGWLWIAVAFHLLRYSSLHWAGRSFAVACALEAALLVAFAATGRFDPGAVSRRLARAGIGVLLFALLLQPLALLLAGRTLRQVEVFGLAPDPTAVATIGAVYAGVARARWALLAIPVAWCAISGATMLATRVPGGWITPAAAGAALLLPAILRFASPGRAATS